MKDKHLIKKHLTTAYRYSFTRLSLNYYTYFETLCERESIPVPLAGLNKTLNQLIKDYLDGSIELKKLDELRNQVIGAMDVINAYIDFFRTYEYVLNRMERRFLKNSVSMPGVEGITDQLMDFLAGSQDSLVFNTRIRSILEQLPVHYTKQKFFSMIRDGLSVYTGSERCSLEDMMYTLKTESLMMQPEDLKTGYEELHEIYNQFKQVEFRSLKNDEYLDLIHKYTDCSQKLFDITSDYLVLMDVINDFYVILLTKDAAVIDASEEQLYSSIIKGVLKSFLNGDTSGIEADITQKLSLLEGRQEKLYERYLGFKLPDGPTEEAELLLQIDKLLSDSLFMELCEERDQELVDTQYLDQAVNQYVSQAEEFFKTCQKPVVWAIMGRILSNLPVFFKSMEEIREYITNCLLSCTSYEQESSIELLLEILESEYALV